MVTPGAIVYDAANGDYYVFLGTLNDTKQTPVSIDLDSCEFQPVLDL